MAGKSFWDNSEKAAEVVRQLKTIKAVIDPIARFTRRLEDAFVLYEMGREEKDEETVQEATEQIPSLFKELERMELMVLLSEPNDSLDAYLSIHAGAGGTESCDWANMLSRMYARWCERRGYKTKIVDSLPDQVAGIKKITYLVSGAMVFGYLKGETGVHRLVRVSPFDAGNRRHTSFASVEVLPKLEDVQQVEIAKEDIRVDTYRASGAGGQHVNRTDSAVRITHLSTGIVVTCQNERSQHMNRDFAMQMLASKLMRRQELEREKELQQIYGEKGEIAWGHQIRSYVMHPYSMVKDHRTSCETSNVNLVMDGAIDNFIAAYLEKRLADREKKG